MAGYNLNDYSNKLKDPRWQDLREKVLKRDEYKCRFCNNRPDSLDIHHIEYIKDLRGNYRDPWLYPIYYFVSLCRDCHDVANTGQGFNSQLLSAASIFLEIKNEYFLSLSNELRLFIEARGANGLYEMLRDENVRNAREDGIDYNSVAVKKLQIA